MNKKKFKGSPIHASLHNTTLTWAAFENNPLIDWPMNFIQEWGALGELNNKGVVANSLGSFFYFILFHVHFLPVIYLEILNSRIKWWKRLSAHIIQSMAARLISILRKIQIFFSQVSDTLIRMRYLCVLSKHKLKWD